MGALQKVVTACLTHQRAVVVNWHTNTRDEVYPVVQTIVGDDRWHVFFTEGKRGWAWKTASTSARRETTLAGMLARIEATP